MVAAVSALSLSACDEEKTTESKRPPGVGSPTREMAKNQPLDAGVHAADPEAEPTERPVEPTERPVEQPVAPPRERPVDVGTPVPPYGVAMPPPRDDVGTAAPAYGAPPPTPSPDEE